MKKEIQEKIDQRKRQVALHAYMYYELDDPIIEDLTFDKWCEELVALISEHGNTELWPHIGWSASTAFHVPRLLARDYLYNKAGYMHRINKKYITK